MSPFDHDALGECSSNEIAAASKVQVLSDNSQDEFLDDDHGCSMEAADAAAKQEKPKIFSTVSKDSSNHQS
jgi:hypothetical protein